MARTTGGEVEGRVVEGVGTWKSIPYAAAPIGELRFAAPAPAPSWDGVRDGSEFGPVATQPLDPLAIWMPEAAGMLYPAQIVQSEDCLDLNIWAPVKPSAEARAVYVWIHGGGFVAGSASALWTDGHNLARQEDIVVVSVTYRLGVFGGFVLDEQGTGGNDFLLDVLSALAWVKTNIAAFGGDPDRVTIGGESAGAMAVVALIAMPSAEGLFHRAIVQSGHGDLNRTPVAAWHARQALLAELGIPEGVNALNRLRALDAETILRAQEVTRRGIPAGPVIDGRILAASPVEVVAKGEQSPVALLIGSNRDEHKMFEAMGGSDPRGLRERLSAELIDPSPEALDNFVDTYRRDGGSDFEGWMLFATDRNWRRPVRDFARFHADTGAAVYRYELNYRSPVRGGVLGAAHSLDIPFPFANLDKPGIDDFLGSTSAAPGRGAVETQCSQSWGSFIRDGVPRSSALPEWPRYSRESEQVMIIAPQPEVATDSDTERTALWNLATVRSPFSAET